jgi:hypothetical protein
MTTQNSNASGIRFYLNLLMVAAYATIAFLVWFQILFTDLPDFNRRAVAATLLAYSAYRLWRTFASRKPKQSS